jgi:hypothetical protein
MRDGLRVAPSRNHIAALLRISEKTVKTALRRLEACGLLKGGELVPPTPDMLAWWQDTSKEERPLPAGHDLPSWDNYGRHFPKLLALLDGAYPQYDWKAVLGRLGRLFREAGYPFEEASNVLVDALNDLKTTAGRATLVRNAEELVQKAEERTAHHRGRGTFHGPHSLGLFRKMIGREVQRLKGQRS